MFDIDLCLISTAHEQAWSKADVLHRDISEGNIIIDVLTNAQRPMGVLIDWDLSKKKDQLNQGGTQKDRSVCLFLLRS